MSVRSLTPKNVPSTPKHCADVRLITWPAPSIRSNATQPWKPQNAFVVRVRVVATILALEHVADALVFMNCPAPTVSAREALTTAGAEVQVTVVPPPVVPPPLGGGGGLSPVQTGASGVASQSGIARALGACSSVSARTRRARAGRPRRRVWVVDMAGRVPGGPWRELGLTWGRLGAGLARPWGYHRRAVSASASTARRYCSSVIEMCECCESERGITPIVSTAGANVRAGISRCSCLWIAHGA